MAPSRSPDDEDETLIESTNDSDPSLTSYVFHGNLNRLRPLLVSQSGIYLELAGGIRILDAAMGAGVAGLGYCNTRLRKALFQQYDKIDYCNSIAYRSEICETYCKALIESTDWKMSMACVYGGSGSDGVEAAIKCSWQYFRQPNNYQPERVNYIGRQQSYHGATMGALSVGGHRARKRPYTDLLLKNMHFVSACNPKIDLEAYESLEEYRGRLWEELECKFQELGTGTVVALVVEPVVGAALGCVSAVPGLLAGYKRICRKYGALCIWDEVMCGMGRTGYMHAWQKEDVVPDIQVLGKGIGNGFPMSAILIGKEVHKVFKEGTGEFAHGHTYQNHPLACAHGLAVLRIIKEDKLVDNVKNMGALLARLLHAELGDHKNVGDIRGEGLFWALYFVKDKASNTSFNPELQIADKFMEKAQWHSHIKLYAGTGSQDGERGDHAMLMPALNITEKEVREIVNRTAGAVRAFFE